MLKAAGHLVKIEVKSAKCTEIQFGRFFFLFFNFFFSTRFVVKPEGGQQCIFDVFLTKPVGVNENLGVERHQRGVKYPNPPDKSSTVFFLFFN